MPLTRVGFPNLPTRSAPIDALMTFKMDGVPMTASGWASGSPTNYITLGPGRVHGVRCRSMRPTSARGTRRISSSCTARTMRRSARATASCWARSTLRRPLISVWLSRPPKTRAGRASPAGPALLFIRSRSRTTKTSSRSRSRTCTSPCLAQRQASPLTHGSLRSRATRSKRFALRLPQCGYAPCGRVGAPRTALKFKGRAAWPKLHERRLDDAERYHRHPRSCRDMLRLRRLAGEFPDRRRWRNYGRRILQIRQ
jgi:hypothetical protein